LAFGGVAAADEPKQRRPDISRAQTLLNFSPRVPLREGLERTLGG
jgi:nucleoside-diphosphate-sugar epimerase